MLLHSLVLMGGTVWMSPAAEPVRNATVVVTDGRIASVGRGRVSVPAGARVIDCKGLTVLAGFWNSHVHFLQRKWENAATLDAQELARQVEAMTTRYGFTSVFDIASDGNNTRAIQDRIGRGELPGPSIRTTGEAIVAPGAVPAPNILRILGNMVTSNHEVTNSSQAALAAQAIPDAGGDGIKIHLPRPIPEDAVRGGRRGQIAPGLAGDLAVVEGDPARDIWKLAAVRYTVREGRVVFSARQQQARR